MEDILPKTGYRARIEKAVKNDAGHPINNGIAMQAHHLLSAKGVQLAAMGKKLEALGYDINVLENLVLLPCTLQGACYLKVQLHRGNHGYHDDDHPRSYHEEVKARIQKLRKYLKDCESCESRSDRERTQKKVQDKMDKVSLKLLELIIDFKIPLTRIFLSFHPESEIGCSNADNISDHSEDSCYSERNHLQNQSTEQKNEKIDYRHNTQYQLRIGQ